MIRRFNRRLFFGLTSLAAFGAGCRLQRKALPQRTFVLQATVGADAVRNGGSGVLLIRPFRVSPAYESRAFVIRRGEAEYTTDAYNAFLMSPGVLITEALATWFRSLGAFAMVTTGGSQVAPTHALEGEVTELYGDYRDPAGPEAHLGLELRLLHPLGGTASAVSWQREIRRSRKLPRAGAEELVAGWNEVMTEIFAALEPELRERFPARRGERASIGR
jgi:ABC-type uncharacterized transport system auxiliary subunit